MPSRPLYACLHVVALLAFVPLSPAAQLATNLEAARGFGKTGAITGTPDGEFLFVAEGAALSIIEPGRPIAGWPQENFASPRKRFQLGEFQPHVVRMIVDPDADLTNGETLSSAVPGS